MSQVQTLEEKCKNVLLGKRPEKLNEGGVKGKFTSSQLNSLKKEYSKLSTIDPEGMGYKAMIVLLDMFNEEQLQQIADADIKFLSKLAINRLNK